MEGLSISDTKKKKKKKMCRKKGAGKKKGTIPFNFFSSVLERDS
jgi:hypothetical protein